MRAPIAAGRWPQLLALGALVVSGSCIPASNSSEAAPQKPAAPAARPAPVNAAPMATPAAASARPENAPRPATIQLRGNIEQGGVALGIVPAGTRRLTFDGRSVDIAPDGRFIIGFGRDYGPSALLVAELADGTTQRLPLTVKPHAWKIEYVNVGMRPGETPSAEYERRRAIELAEMGAARRIEVRSDGWRQQFQWPVTGRVSGLFGSQRVYRGTPGSFHGGVDVARPSGTIIVAPADGEVILAAKGQPYTLEGHLLMVNHGMGLSSAFLHLSRIDVNVGDKVRRGQILGAIGTTGRSTGPHLHWGMKWEDQRIDPMMLTGPMPVTQPLPAPPPPIPRPDIH